jgi:hypothetical protein
MPSPPTYYSVITDMAGAVIGPLRGAKALTISLRHKGLPTVGLQVPLWHPYAEHLISQDVLLKVYRRDTLGTNKLLFIGPVLGAEENGDTLNQTLAVTAVGPFWRLTKRRIGMTKAGIEFGSEATPVDLARIARDALVTANGAGYTGIEAPVDPAHTQIANGGTGIMWVKNVAELITELAAGLNSFDFRVDPIEPTNVGKAFPQIGYLNIQPMIGSSKPNVIFEYGTGRANVASYSRSISRDEMLNQAIVNVQGWPDASSGDLIVRNDTAAQTARGLLQEVVPDGGITDDTMRTQIADEHLKYRSSPKVIVKFTPVLNAVPSPFVHYDVGDWVRARAVVRESVRFDSMMRIWGLTLSIDDGGNESTELQLVQEDA